MHARLFVYISEDINPFFYPTQRSDCMGLHDGSIIGLPRAVLKGKSEGEAKEKKRTNEENEENIKVSRKKVEF